MQQDSLTAKDIIDRPANSTVLIIASGKKAGEMVGIDEIEWSVGFDADCRLRFSNEEYPALEAKVTCRKTPQGWMVKRIRGENVFVNQTQLDERLPVRSGDIVRLGTKGPDFQFNLQNAGFSVKTLVEKYMPDQPATRQPPNDKNGAITPTNAAATNGAAASSPNQVRSLTSKKKLSPQLLGIILTGIAVLALFIVIYFIWSLA
jgi:hypothetical protein